MNQTKMAIKKINMDGVRRKIVNGGGSETKDGWV
jgi:hypothetical protein